MTDSFIVAVSPPPAVPLLFWEKKSCHLLFNLRRSIVSILDIARVRNKPRFLINVWRGGTFARKKNVKCQSVRMFFSRQAFGAHTRNRLPRWGRCFAVPAVKKKPRPLSSRLISLGGVGKCLLQLCRFCCGLSLMAVCERITSV